MIPDLIRITVVLAVIAAAAVLMWRAPANAPPRSGCDLTWSGGVELWRCPK